MRLCWARWLRRCQTSSRSRGPRGSPGWGDALDPILGAQQDAALKVGLLGAYAGRGLMLLIAHQIVRYPWLQLVGGAYLVYLGIEHLGCGRVPKTTATVTPATTENSQLLARGVDGGIG